ncbi:MAG: reprolysin-like metallopeptidase [Bacteroidota bacterium]
MNQSLPALRQLKLFCSIWSFSLLLLTTFSFSNSLQAQGIWQNKTVTEEVDQRIFPKDARQLELDTSQMLPLLWSAPHEQEVTPAESTVRITLPGPAGENLEFNIVAYDIAEQTALDRYPHIRTWYGQEVRNPARTVFLDWTERGFHAVIRGGDEPIIYLDPLGRNSLIYYQSYFANGVENSLGFQCATEAEQIQVDSLLEEQEERVAFGCDLLQYRTAIACTAEYSNYHGATNASQSGLVQSAVVTSVSRLNSIMTQDLSLRLLLVGNNDELYYYNANTDPYTGTSVGALIGQNTANINSEIGSAAYDLGHVYTQGANNGVASLRSPCTGNKGRGATSHSVPENDPFNVDYVAHEMGHQFGANHTQNNSCNYSSSAGMEPGSASSIMGYAGICSPNVQNNSDAYFHGRSIQEINFNIENPSGTGNSCVSVINTSLNNPVLVAQSDETVPFGTPLVLKGDATGTATITYNWEQYDTEQGPMPPQGTSTQGPLFRTFFATSSPERFLPKLEDVVAGNDPTWEETPMVSRLLDFRLTVRHSTATYGCTGEDDIRLTVDGDHGPFVVTDPANGNQWSAGQTAQVQWDVAGTDANGINCATVDIYLSLDGGSSWSILANGEANDGLAEITLPASTSNQARIMVRAADNVFYNISPIDFSIVSAQGSPAITLSGLDGGSRSSCFLDAAESVSYQFLTTSSGGAELPLNLSVNGLPTGATATFVPASPRPGGTFRLIISNMDGAAAGTYNLTLSATSAETNQAAALTLVKSGSSGSPGPIFAAPFDGAVNIDILPTLQIQDQGALSYDYQLSSNASFSNLLLNISQTTDLSVVLTDYLEANTTYFWRSRSNASGGCGVSLWRSGSFTTGDCYVYASTAAPVNIPNDAPPTLVEMSLSIPDNGQIDDLDLYQLDISHTWIGDLEVSLISPDNTTALILDRPCTREDDIFSSFNDESPLANFPCPPTLGEFYQSASDPLSVFDGEEINGQWILRVDDLANQDGGSLNAFKIKACLSNFNALPVEWLSFSTTAREKTIDLVWETAEEVNNRGFTIERQSLARQDSWEAIAFVPANGNAQARYFYEDREVQAGIDYYYRLRQEDLDGSISYSPIRSARLDQAATPLLVFPNPTADVLYFRRSNPDSGLLRYQLISANGQLVLNGQITRDAGSIPLQRLTAGVYQLRILDEQGQYVQRIIKL